MARTSGAVLAALLAASPVLATAQTTTTTPPVVTPQASAAAEKAKAAADTATDAAKDAQAATEKAADAATAATDAAKTATDAAPATTPAATPAANGAAETPAPAAGTAAPAAPGAAATAPAGDQIGSYYTKSTHDDWLLRCLKTQDGKDPCELYQLLKDQNDKPVAEISVIPFSGKASAILNFIAPLETDLQAGLGLKIDNAKENRYPFMVCAPIGCVARIGLTDAELGALKKGSKAGVSLLPFGADPAKDLVNLNMSLKGFTAGFTGLQETITATQ